MLESKKVKIPQCASFTLTNACNLRCKMCGQWNEHGYINKKERSIEQMSLDVWKRVVDELTTLNINSVLLRGGEAFLFPGIIELIEYIRSKNIYTSIDTNGTLLDEYAEKLVSLGNIHITISIDGPSDIHDKIRGMPGCFQRIQENLKVLSEMEKKHKCTISKSMTFTITSYNYKYLSMMPDIARRLSIPTITIVPGYWLPESAGKEYEKELMALFNCKPFSYKGFILNNEKPDTCILTEELRKYKENLKSIYSFPYMELSEDEYVEWFSSYYIPVGNPVCSNIERLVDIQPDGSVNFCVDFPDYILGNIQSSSIVEIWNSLNAENFRKYRRKNKLAVCHRCGAKYMSEIMDKV